MPGFYVGEQKQAEKGLREKYETLIARARPSERKALQAELKQKLKELRKSFF
jgi:hypothetical protein